MLKTSVILTALFAIAINTHAKSVADTVNVYFSNNDHRLNAAGKHLINSLLYEDVLAPGRKVGVIGYADNVGDEAANKALSEQRALSVKQYLLSMQIDSSDIEWVTGMGEISRTANEKGYPQDRKVAIIPGGFRKSIQKIQLAGKLGDIIKFSGDTPVIDASQVQLNSVFKLDNVYFKLGSSELMKESTPMLNALTTLLRDNPTIKIQIEGHICCAEPYKLVDNKKVLLKEGETDTTTVFTVLNDLSVHRAHAVYAYLVYTKGILPGRIKYVGYGVKRRLVSPEVTEQDKAANRRVEVRVLEK